MVLESGSNFDQHQSGLPNHVLLAHKIVELMKRHQNLFAHTREQVHPNKTEIIMHLLQRGRHTPRAPGGFRAAAAKKRCYS